MVWYSTVCVSGHCFALKAPLAPPQVVGRRPAAPRRCTATSPPRPRSGTNGQTLDPANLNFLVKVVSCCHRFDSCTRGLRLRPCPAVTPPPQRAAQCGSGPLQRGQPETGRISGRFGSEGSSFQTHFRLTAASSSDGEKNIECHII